MIFMPANEIKVTDVASYVANAKASISDSSPDEQQASQEPSEDVKATEEAADESDKPEENTEVEESEVESKEEEQDSEEQPKESKKLDVHKTLAKKEREWVNKEKTYKSENATLRQSLQDYEQRVSQWFEQFKADPYKVLEQINPNAYEEWSMRKLGVAPEQKQTKPVEDPRIAKLEQEIQKLSTTEYNRAIEKAIQSYSNDVHQLANDEKYTLAKEYCEQLGSDLISEVVLYADKYASAYKKALTPDEALSVINDHILKEIEFAQSVKSKKSDKSVESKVSEEKPRDEKGKFKSKNLNNSMKSGTSAGKKPVVKDKESYIAMLKELAKD